MRLGSKVNYHAVKVEFNKRHNCREEGKNFAVKLKKCNNELKKGVNLYIFICSFLNLQDTALV